MQAKPVLIIQLHFADALKSLQTAHLLNIETDLIMIILKMGHKSLCPICFYPLTPPRATPAIIYLDNNKYTIISGKTVRVRPK